MRIFILIRAEGRIFKTILNFLKTPCRNFAASLAKSQLAISIVFRYTITKVQFKMTEKFMLEDLKQPIGELKESILNVWGRL